MRLGQGTTAEKPTLRFTSAGGLNQYVHRRSLTYEVLTVEVVAEPLQLIKTEGIRFVRLRSLERLSGLSTLARRVSSVYDTGIQSSFVFRLHQFIGVADRNRQVRAAKITQNGEGYPDDLAVAIEERSAGTTGGRRCIVNNLVL